MRKSRLQPVSDEWENDPGPFSKGGRNIIRPSSRYVGEENVYEWIMIVNSNPLYYTLYIDIVLISWSFLVVPRIRYAYAVWSPATERSLNRNGFREHYPETLRRRLFRQTEMEDVAVGHWGPLVFWRKSKDLGPGPGSVQSEVMWWSVIQDWSWCL